ncbi:MAG: hypothetical protein AB2L07_08220 [Thermoanaerobaculaceae bacterium]
MRCPNPECPDTEWMGKAPSYVEGVTICPRCGTLLEPEPVEAALPEKDLAAAAPVEVAEFLFRQDAELAASLLEADGIDSVVLADDAGNVNAGVGAGRVRLLVAAEDGPRASELLAAEAGETEAEE